MGGAVVAGGPVGATGFVGRERELAAVTGALAGGAPALVVIEGEAGIGKSRLLAECLASSLVAGRRVLVAGCPPVPEPFPLGPIVDAVREWHVDLGALELSPLVGALRPVFPEWAAGLPPAPEPAEDARAGRHRLLTAVAELLHALGVEVLVVDDVHWADTPTLELLLMLASRPEPHLSVVVTHRPEDVADDSLVRRLTSHAPAGMTRLRVELEPLTAAQCGALVASMFGTDRVSAEFATFLHRATEGLPLALEESVRLLQDRRDIIHQHGQWARLSVEELRVPATVRDSVLERVARLRPQARRVLEAAAVLADPAGERLLAQVADVGEQDARPGVAGALASSLLVEAAPGRFGFRHVLACRAVYEAIGATERARLHQQAGRVLERADPLPVAQLARHFRAAGDVEAWSRYGEAAAGLALEAGDDRTAVVMLLDLATEAPHPGQRHGRLARGLAEAAAGGASELGDLAGRVTGALRAALDREDLPEAERGEIGYLLGRLLLQHDQLEAGYAQIERAVGCLAHSPTLAARAMLLLSTSAIDGLPVDHGAWLDRAAALLPQVSAAADRVALVAHRAVALLELGQAEGWDAAAGLPGDADTTAGRRDLARGYGNLAIRARGWGRYAQAQTWLDTARELIEAGGYARMRDVERINRAFLDYCTGAWREAAAIAAELAASDETHPLTRLEAQTLQGLLALAAGDTRTADRGLRAVLAQAPGTRLAAETRVAAAGLARLQLATGAAADAAATTTAAADTVAATGIWLYATDIAPVRVDALIQVGATGQAEELVERFAGWLAGRDVPACEAALTSCRASLAAARGDPPDAAELFARAAEAWAALPRPYDELLALERRGRCLLDAGQVDQALSVLAATQQRLTELGARWDADRVAHLLRRHGAPLPRPWHGGRRGYGDQLSPREMEVVRLAATGATNPQIAQALYLSPKTVARHLGAAMRKLGVHSRTAVAMAAAEAGLLADDHPPSNDNG